MKSKIVKYKPVVSKKQFQIRQAMGSCYKQSSKLRALSDYVIEQSKTVEDAGEKKGSQFISPDIRFIYPEFLPDPAARFRYPIREKLERQDMLRRRTQVNIPEFYVGSIVAVTSSNQHAPSKSTRFVGICIQRKGCGLKATFMVRNVVDNMGMDILYSLYDPLIQKIDVLRLEKRLDEELLYLRDAYPEYSTFPFDMEPEYLPAGTPVPVNQIKVKLKPHPWKIRYERKFFKGVQVLDSLPEKSHIKAEEIWKAIQYEKYDLMKQYRSTIPAEEQEQIYSEVYSELQKLEITKRKLKKRKEFIPPKKSA